MDRLFHVVVSFPVPLRRLNSAAYVAQSLAEARCQATATVMWMPSMRASTAAGRSVASWSMAAERDRPGCTPSWRRRSASWKALIGWPGWPRGEQPRRSALIADDSVTVPAGGELQDEGVRGRGKHDGLAAQPYPHLAVCDLDE